LPAWPRAAALVMLVAGVTATCGGGAQSASPVAPSAPATQFSTYQSARFTFRYTTLDAANVAQTAAAIESEHARITQDLNVAQMPTVVVTLYPNVDTLRQAVLPIVGPIPAFASGLVTAVDAIHIVSPNAASAGRYADAVVNIVHEFAHCVSLRVNPSFANNPRWLWESVALFEAGQYTDPRTLPYFSVGPLPTLAQLNSFDNTIVYSVGATFGRFIVDTRGSDAYLALVRANGDLDRVLGTTEAAFLNEWRAFVRDSFHVP
jgi:hypothetical protein